MGRVLWKNLKLVGFGRYRDGVSLQLSDGINPYIAGNEEGKSTLVAGLMAVLFGLPYSRSLDKFGTERYRNWDGSSQFEGEVLFEVDDVTYRIWRDFDTHRISLSRQTNDEWVEEVTGEHKPNARKRNIRYEERLTELLGISSQDLFSSIFCISQPFPRSSQLDDELQRLLSGTGDYNHALKVLRDELSQLTRFTGDLGVTPRNAFKDGKIEELEGEIRNLEGAIAHTEDVSSELNHIYNQLFNAEKERTKKSSLLGEMEGTFRAWNDWRILIKDYRRTLNEYKSLKDGEVKAKAMVERVKNGLASLRKEFPEFKDFIKIEDSPQVEDADHGRVGEVLKRLSDLTTAESGLSKKLKEYQNQLKELKEKEEGLERSLEGFAELINRSELLRNHNDLLKCSEDIDSLERDLRAGDGPELIELIHDRIGLLKELGDIEKELHEARDFLDKVHMDGKRKCFIITMVTAIIGFFFGFFFSPPLIFLVLFPVISGLIGLFIGRRSLKLTEENEDKRLGISVMNQQLKEVKACLMNMDEEFPYLAALSIAELEERRHLLQVKKERLSTLKGARAILRESVKPFDEFTPHEELIERVGDYQRLLGELSDLEGKVKFVSTRIRELESEIRDIEAEEKELRFRVKDVTLSLRDDISLALDRWNQWVKIHDALVMDYNSLRSFLLGYQVDSLEALETKAFQSQTGVLSISKRLEDLLREHPGLPSLDEVAAIEEVEAKFNELKGTVGSLREELGSLNEKIHELTKTQAQLEGKSPLNIAIARDDLYEKRIELDRLKEKAKVLAMAYSYLDDAIKEFHGSYREYLEGKATEYFRGLTYKSNRNVRFEDDFSIYVEEDGQICHISQLSQGAQDQLYLSIRLAIADLISHDIQLPFIFDDSFLNTDSKRLQKIRETLEGMERQVLLFSHRDEFLEWSKNINTLY